MLAEDLLHNDGNVLFLEIARFLLAGGVQTATGVERLSVLH
jgi:hypothetical protein